MRAVKLILKCSGLLLLMLALGWACGHDSTFRAYLEIPFWSPFAKHASHFERTNVRRVSAPFAGMVKVAGTSPLEKLRAAYQDIGNPDQLSPDFGRPGTDAQRKALAIAQADASLTPKEREEVALIEAKIDIRAATDHDAAPLESAKVKLQAFIKTAKTPEFRSEARGWLAHVYYEQGNQTAAGKIYLDELNRNGSNLSRDTLLTSLRMNYGYTGGAELREHIAEYFDTAEHAAFAIQLVTNPDWDPEHQETTETDRVQRQQAYQQISKLLAKHANLLQSGTGANALAMLTMRTALRMGDVPGVLKIADMIPGDSSIRNEPDYLWMQASAYFLTRDYTKAEAPLLSLFQSAKSSKGQKAAAAYGLCGVYQKLKNPVEQIRFALWMSADPGLKDIYGWPVGLADQSVYWDPSGLDLGAALDFAASVDDLRSFLEKYPNVSGIRKVKYALAVRLTRIDQYDEAAQIYQDIGAKRRAPRIRQLAALYKESRRFSDIPQEQLHEAQYRLAEFLNTNEDGIYFNDNLWSGFQREALTAANDTRLTRAERDAWIAAERELKDSQEEHWRAYRLLDAIVQAEGKTELGRKAALLALRCLGGINLDRFGREKEIETANREFVKYLRK